MSKGRPLRTGRDWCIQIGEWIRTSRAQATKQVQPDDDAVEYVEKDEPVCTCDIKELTLGQGHSKECPHYPKEQS